MEAAIAISLKRLGVVVENAPTAAAVLGARTHAPDLMLLVGDAVKDGGEKVLRRLAGNPAASVVPVALLMNDVGLDQRLRAFRSGAVAVVPRGASADDLAKRLAKLVKELPERPGEAAGTLGEATLDELVQLVSKELRSGILSVERNEDSPMRLVLGAGGNVAQAVDRFVQQLKPLIHQAEPLRYEFHESSGGRLHFLDGESTGDLSHLEGLRMLILDNDPARADGLAQVLRGAGALVAVMEAGPRGLQRARELDPEVIVLDAAAIEGERFEAVREVRRDPRLRWASLLVARWDELWPEGAAAPDIALIAGKISPLTQHDRVLRQRGKIEEQFDTRLELTGPGRLIRALGALPGLRCIEVQSAVAKVAIDVGDGLVVGAQGQQGQRPLEGLAALGALMAATSGRVQVSRKTHPATANVMSPVDEALDAAQKSAPVNPSQPPPPLFDADRTPVPFPTLEQLRSHPPKKPLYEPSSDGPKPAAPGSLHWEGPKTEGSKVRKKTMLGLGIGSLPPKAEEPRSDILTEESSKPKVLPSSDTDETLRPSSVEALFEGIPSIQPDEMIVEDEQTVVGDSLALAEEKKKTGPRRGATGVFQAGGVPPVAVPPKAKPIPTTTELLGLEEEDEDEDDIDPLAQTVMAERDAAEAAALDAEAAALDAIEGVAVPEEPDDAGEPEAEGSDAEPTQKVVVEPEAAAPLSEPPFASSDETTEIIEPEPKKSRTPWGLVFLGVTVLGAGAAAVATAPQWMPLLRGAQSTVEEPVDGVEEPEEVEEEAPEESGTEEAVQPETTEEAVPEQTEEPASEEVEPEPEPEPETVPEESAPEEPAPEEPTPEPESTEPAASDVQVDPSLSQAQRERRSDALSLEAERAVEAGNLDDAGRLVQEALAHDPENPRAHAASGAYHLARGNGQEALRWAQLAARRRARRPQYHVLVGDARRALGDESGARRAYRRALRVNENYGPARQRLNSR